MVTCCFLNIGNADGSRVCVSLDGGSAGQPRPNHLIRWKPNSQKTADGVCGEGGLIITMPAQQSFSQSINQ